MRFWAALLAALLLGAQSMALPIEKLQTKLGEVWLVEAPQLPMVSILLSFRAGSVFEPAGKDGLANYTATLLEETGAGPYDAQAFKEQAEDVGVHLSVGAGKLNFTVEITTLKENLPRALELADLMLTQSHFDEADGVRVREALYANLKQSLENPRVVARRQFVKALYGKHPYGSMASGELETIEKFTAKDAKDYAHQQLNLANLSVSVIGQVNKTEITELLNKYLGNLPKGSHRNAVETGPQDPTPKVYFIKRDVPQAAVYMGHLGTNKHAPDRFALRVLNYILGGGGMASRLFEEVREKKGLVYDVSSNFDDMPFKGGFTVALQTKNETVDEAVQLVKKEINDIIAHGVTDAQYKAAIDYLTGSFPLGLDTNSKILDSLDVIQTEDLPDDYLDTWVQNTKKVSKADIQKAAIKYLHPDHMVIVVVGGEKPEIAKGH